jgi:hypothetical protein
MPKTGLGLGLWSTFLSVWIVASHIYKRVGTKGGVRSLSLSCVGRGSRYTSGGNVETYSGVARTVADEEAVELLPAEIIVVRDQLKYTGEQFWRRGFKNAARQSEQYMTAFITEGL